MKVETTTWRRVLEALQAAAGWEGVDRNELAGLQIKAREARGKIASLDPVTCRDILYVILDGRSAQFLGENQAAQDTARRSLISLMGGRARLAPVSIETPSIIDIRPIRLRDYQREYVDQTVAAMRRGADSKMVWRGEHPKDRGYLISPWQTGKSLLATPVAREALEIFPGRKILILSPYEIITKQMVGDLLEGFEGTIGVVDKTHKEFDRQAVVASALTLRNHLRDLKPREVGLVIVDEMTFSLAPSWLKILKRLGFIRSNGEIIPAPGKFLLGLGTTGERGDGRHIREVFGDTFLGGKGLNWFVDRGYLHEPLGLEVPYGSLEGDWERFRAGRNETIVVMRDSPENRARLIEAYQKHLAGKKTLIFTARVAEATHLAEDFNRTYGEGYATVVTRETSDWDMDQRISDFNSGAGPRVLLTVRRISTGARLRGVGGEMFNFQTDSLNRFGDSAGRGLARLPGEPQRTVLVVTLEGRGKPLDRPQSVATMMGYRGKTPTGAVYRPRELRREGRRVGVARTGVRALAKLAVGQERARELRVRADGFARALNQVLDQNFDGDLITFAERAKLSSATVDAYLSGIIPPSFEEVVELARRLRVSYASLTEPWVKDEMALLNAAYPLSKEIPYFKRKLVELIREAIVRTAKEGALTSLVRGKKQEYHRVVKGFSGDLPLQAESLRFYFDLILNAGFVDESEVRDALGRYVEEQRLIFEREVGKPYEEHGSREFDHRYVDLMDVAEAVSITDGIRDRSREVGSNVPYPLWGEMEPRVVVETPELFEDGRPVPDPTEILEREETARRVRRGLASLTPREAWVFRERFGLDGGEDQTLKTLARARGISMEVIRRTGASAARKFRDKQRAPFLLGKGRLSPLAFEMERERDQKGTTRGVLSNLKARAKVSWIVTEPFEKLYVTLLSLNPLQRAGSIRVELDSSNITLLDLMIDSNKGGRPSPEQIGIAEGFPPILSKGEITHADLWFALDLIFSAALKEHHLSSRRRGKGKRGGASVKHTAAAARRFEAILSSVNLPLEQRKTPYLIANPTFPTTVRLFSGLAALEEGWEIMGDWWHETEGIRLPATPEILARFGLQEPSTILGRLRRFGPAEGIPGLLSIFAAPFVTQSILKIDPHRRPGEFHIANLGALHMLNSAGGAVADIVAQMRRGVSAVQIGNQVATSPSLTRTGLRSFAHRVGTVAGLAEGVVWAYPGYVLGEETASLVTDGPTAKAIGGGAGAVGVPLGLRIWLGQAGMQRLASTAAGRLAGPVGAATLLNDFVIGAHESFVRRGLSDEAITLREKAIEATPWWDRFVANLMIFFSIAGHDPSNFFEPQLTLEDALAKRDQIITKK